MSTAYILDPSGKLVTLVAGTVTAVFRDLITDKLFTGAGYDASAKFTSATARLEGTWTRRVLTPKAADYGWLAVESDFLDKDGTTARSVVVTLYSSAGVSLTSKTISSQAAVRLPPLREKLGTEFIVSVVSKAIVTRVTMASTNEELKAL